MIINICVMSEEAMNEKYIFFHFTRWNKKSYLWQEKNIKYKSERKKKKNKFLLLRGSERATRSLL